MKDKASGVVLVNNGSIYIPLEVNWQQGKKYSYTLVFGQGEQGFKPDGSHDDNLLQIKYSVSAENWNAAGNEDLGMGGGFEKPLQPLTYNTGTNVKLIHKAEYCKSIIADGKELITGKESGELIVPELKDPKVYITFKEGITNFSDAFYACLALKSIPENLFANCPKVNTFFQTFAGCSSLESIPEQLFAHNPNVTDFTGTFSACSALESIPENLFASNPAVTDFGSTFSNCSALATIPEKLFANCPKVTSFSRTFLACKTLKSVPAGLFDNNRKVTDFGSRFYGLFQNCSALTGESPYTVIDGQKVHLYERANYPEHFTAPSNVQKTFRECYNLTDYNQIPSNWK